MSEMSEMQFLRQANLDIIQLKAELGLDDTPIEFEDFLEETKQNTPKAVRAAEYEFENSYDADQQAEFEHFLRQSGQIPAANSSLNPAAASYSGNVQVKLDQGGAVIPHLHVLTFTTTLLTKQGGVRFNDSTTLVQVKQLANQINRLKAELGINETPEEFEQFLDNTKQSTPRRAPS
jgi:hypothetical protein